MVCDPELKCLTRYLRTQIEQRRKRGRPGARKGDRSDGEEEEDSRAHIDAEAAWISEVRSKMLLGSVECLMEFVSGGFRNGDCGIRG